LVLTASNPSSTLSTESPIEEFPWIDKFGDFLRGKMYKLFPRIEIKTIDDAKYAILTLLGLASEWDSSSCDLPLEPVNLKSLLISF